MTRLRIPVNLLVVVLAAGCQNAGHDRVVGIEATSEVRGLAYFDADRSRSFDSADTRMRGLRVSLSAQGTSENAVTAVSDASGSLRFPGVPVGRYDVRVDPASTGDTVVVVRVDTSQIAVTPGDTISVTLGVSYPLVAVAEVRSGALGKKVFVAGVALTGANVFADTTAHLVAATGPLRLVRVFRGLFAAGDSMLARGTVGVRDGERVLTDVSAYTVGVGTLSAPDSLATATAANANVGVLDAGLVRVAGTLQDTVTVGRDLALNLNDGSGLLRVLLDGDVLFQLSRYLVNPARVVATGVLVPGTTGTTWFLKPRSNLDLNVQVDVVSTVQARQRTAGTRVFVDGVALNRPNLFGDSTLHLADSAGAIRVIKSVQSNIFAGDSIRVAGAVGSRDGQVVISDPTVFRLGVGTEPNARRVTTAEAASAIGGVLDAALVQVTGTIMDTTRVGGDFRAVLWDGSGDSVTVVLDRDIGFPTAGWAIGVTAEVQGILVPQSGVWVVKPRAQGGDVFRP